MDNTIYLYPILLIVSTVIFYILGKKNGTQKEVIKTVTHYNNEPVNLYNDETEDQYYLRCHNFIAECLTKRDLRYHASNDYKSFVLELEDDGNSCTFNFEAYYNKGRSYIMFYTKILDRPVPDNKLAETSELINRLNNALILSTLQLDYQNRMVESILIYPVNGESLNQNYFDFYFKALLSSRSTGKAFNRVIYENAEPALVTIDFMAR